MERNLEKKMETRKVRLLIILVGIIICGLCYWAMKSQEKAKDTIKKTEVSKDEVNKETNDENMTMVVANAEPYSCIKKDKDENSEDMGILYKNDTACVVSEDGEWCEVISGDVSGYVKKENLTENKEENFSFDSKLPVAFNLDIKENFLTTEQVSTVSSKKKVKLSSQELKYLACITYAEAGGEAYRGKVAVANVVLNRYKSKYYPNSVKGVVTQRGQFSPYRNGALSRELSKYSSGRYNKDYSRKSTLKAVKQAMNGTTVVGNRYFFNGARAESRRYHRNSLRIGNHLFW